MAGLIPPLQLHPGLHYEIQLIPENQRAGEQRGLSDQRARAAVPVGRADAEPSWGLRPARYGKGCSPSRHCVRPQSIHPSLARDALEHVGARVQHPGTVIHRSVQ